MRIYSKEKAAAARRRRKDLSEKGVHLMLNSCIAFPPSCKKKITSLRTHTKTHPPSCIGIKSNFQCPRSALVLVTKKYSHKISFSLISSKFHSQNFNSKCSLNSKMAAEVENPPAVPAAEEKKEDAPVEPAAEVPAVEEEPAVEKPAEEVKEAPKEAAKEPAPKKPNVFKQDFVKDVVYLYQFARTTSLPSLSPYVLKVETWLRLTGLKYEVSSALFDTICYSIYGLS